LQHEPNRPDFHKLVQQLADHISASESTVILTGAGISTESGIPDFRSPSSGLWNQIDPMEAMSTRAFQDSPKRFYEIALKTWLSPLVDAKPNSAHRAIATLQASNLISGIITQNIDGLHQKAGSQQVLEVHGHVRTVTCTCCRRSYPMEFALKQVRHNRAPLCSDCNAPLKPDIVLFGDAMSPDFESALELACNSDLLIVVGSSLMVGPANTLPLYAGSYIINNLDTTPLDHGATLLLPFPAGQVWPAVEEILI